MQVLGFKYSLFPAGLNLSGRFLNFFLLCSLSGFSSWSVTVMKERKKEKQNIFCCDLRYFPRFHRYEKRGFKQIHNLLFALVDWQALLETCRMDVYFVMAPGTTEGSQGRARTSKLSLPWSSLVPNFPISVCLLFPLSRGSTANLGQGTHGICFSRHFLCCRQLGANGLVVVLHFLGGENPIN